ncbi:hypothetical protein [Limimaricola hongkongensis]|uniref:DUF3108 domain-containing protein n=1 Tax=Limimaricola hongkongensis DSM 17492 TaxID=1122180 RepID=A0A017H9Y9_9RHOB|nr:hypothetical protein [Limimaricola hongkongensis]EYD70569.1 hypothetical protein Lokhon_02203 [Limimaricola hongkongensis DSM 17492]
MPFCLPRLFSCLGLGLCLSQAALAAQADTRFEIALGGDRLGRITHAAQGSTRDLTLLLDSTPFGVFDGSYAGRTVTTGPVARHSGRTRSTRKSRDVSMRTERGELRAVTLSPEAERTALTDADAVSGPVLDPVDAFGRLLETGACPDGLRIYDGRRVGLLTLEQARREGTRITCRAGYRVTAGPGYLEPLGVSRLSVELTYDTGSGDWRLLRIAARSGPFGLVLDRAAEG